MVADHVADVHTSADGAESCRHGPLEGAEPGRPWLKAGSRAHRAVRRVVLHERTLRLAQHVVTFRWGRQGCMVGTGEAAELRKGV